MTKHWSQLGLATLVGLAPANLPTFRGTRYQGENERRFLANFGARDRALLKSIYGTLLELFLKLRPLYHDHHASLEIVERFLVNSEDVVLSLQVQEFGRETLAGPPGDLDCARTIHDLRGGAFQALALRLDLMRAFPEIARSMPNIFFLLRDHLKIMRNCIADLDYKRFAKDASRQDHAASYLVEKWASAEFNAVKQSVAVELACHFKGTLCESCLEFSTLDRIIYNLMNNAAKYSADGKVDFTLLSVPEENPVNIRLAIANAITPGHRQTLENAFAGNLGSLFKGGFSTGGHGLGLRICADFCAQAYGITDFEKARAEGYFGAKLFGDYFVSWFHWPIATQCG